MSTTHGLEMETAEISGKGWRGIEGEVPLRSMTKTGEQGPELFIFQELIGIDTNRSLLITSDNTDELWGIDDLLISLEGLTIGDSRSAR